MPGLLFVTAPEADHKLINRLLLSIRDWEYECGDSFQLILTKNAYELDPPSGPNSTEPAATSPPIKVDLHNAWKGASIKDVEDYCLEIDRSNRESSKAHLFVVADSEGFKNQTCVLAERVIEWQSDPITYPEKFNKVRMPWDELYLAWCNLDISNMDFNDFVDDAKGEQDGWFTYHSVNEGRPDLSEENQMLRDAEIEKLEREGKA